VTDHPITPPLELVQQWGHDANLSGVPHNDEHWAYEQHIATRAAQWGADQELEACCKWFQEFYKTESWVTHDLKHFRSARRPKPPSLKEQALGILDVAHQDVLGDDQIATIRRALEQLND
jgi:hypothetical protein